MTLQEFVQKGWADHGDDPEGVFARLPEGVELASEPAHIPALAGLIVHVAGEHCGKWGDGLALLARLRGLDAFDAESPEGKSLWRSAAILHLCAGELDECDACVTRGRSGEDSSASDWIRVLAVAASALAGQHRIHEASDAFQRAVELAGYGPGKDDPAARALAITGNNLACELENKADRTDDESKLMLTAARAGRRFWEVAGTWMNVERAEYRLAMTHLARNESADALRHAFACLEVCVENGADAGEMFFAHEALTKSWHAHGDGSQAATHRAVAARCVPQVEDEGFRAYCAGELSKLDALLA